MATREQWMEALKKADAAAQAGNQEAVADAKRIAAKIREIDAAGGGAPQAEAPAQPGLYERPGGLSDYLPGSAMKGLQRFSDITTSAQDATTRGFGSDDQMVDEARARAGNATIPGDIIASIATSPYRVAGVGTGMLAGGLEGGISAYGHQDKWLPDAAGWADIGTQTAIGSGLGGAGAKLGEWGGKLVNAFRPKQPFSTADELYTAAERAGKRQSPGKRSRDTMARAERMKAAELAQAEGRGGFQKLLEGMDRPPGAMAALTGTKPSTPWPHAEKVKVTELANQPNFSARALEAAGDVVRGGSLAGSFPMARAFGAVPGVLGSALKMGARMSNDIDPKQVAQLKAMILDSKGRMKTDKATVDLARDFMAKLLMQGGTQ